ncbi:hypothetical protein GCM10009628_01690 [Paeniglutamicibacter kerguelensis]
MLIDFQTRTKKRRIQLKVEGSPRMFAAGCVAVVFLVAGAGGASPIASPVDTDIPAVINQILD